MADNDETSGTSNATTWPATGSRDELGKYRAISTKRERVTAAIQADPKATNTAIARATNTSRDTVRRVRLELAPPTMPAAPGGSAS